MLNTTVPQNGHVSQEQNQLFLTIQQGQETLQRPLTGEPDEGDPADHVQQVAVLVVGLDCFGDVLAVVPHRPFGLQVIPDDGLGEASAMADSELQERAAWFQLDTLPPGPIFPQGNKIYTAGDYSLDVELVLERLGLVSNDSQAQIDILWTMLNKGLFSPDQARRFLAALAFAYGVKNS